MGKKKRGKRSGGDGRKIGLESAVDSDDGDMRGGGGWDDDADAADERERRELSGVLARGRGAPRAGAYGEQTAVLAISGSDSDTDVEEQVRRRRKQEKKAARKKDRREEEEEEAAQEEAGQAGDFASDLDDGGSPLRYEDELIGGEGWGKKKRHFYGGNPNERRPTGPDEERAGSDEDEAQIEARESRKLQARQLEAMDEADFLEAFAADLQQQKVSSQKATSSGESIKTDVSQLSRKERARLVAKESPELAGVAAEFDSRMQEAAERLAPVVRLMDEGKLPSDGAAAQYVRTKYQLVLNYCTNLSCYFMFKSKRVSLQLHPLTSRLVQYKQLLEKIEPLDEVMMAQMEEVLRADKAGTLQEAVKRAKKRAMKDGVRNKAKGKKLRILQDDRVDDSKSKQSASASSVHDDLTLDEARAFQMYQAARKLNRDEEDDSADEEGEKEDEEEDKGAAEVEREEPDGERRLITRQIEKNKGLTPKRNKLQRNPRVKHRDKFRKAKVRRKGQVREVRKEERRYGGEASGINARVKKGVKLA